MAVVVNEATSVYECVGSLPEEQFANAPIGFRFRKGRQTIRSLQAVGRDAGGDCAMKSRGRLYATFSAGM